MDNLWYTIIFKVIIAFFSQGIRYRFFELLHFLP